jgi:hypothetical protein
MATRKKDSRVGAPPSLRPVIGWREWVTLPAIEGVRVKVKVDTGARTSSLHVCHLQLHEADGITTATFEVQPVQRRAKPLVTTTARVAEFRSVRSSSGHSARRPVIITPVRLGGEVWDIELTLTSRDEMGFRMLLGREAVRGRFVVDPSRSYQAGESQT